MTSPNMVAFQEGWKRIYDDGVLVLEDFLETGKIRPNVPQPTATSAGSGGSIQKNINLTDEKPRVSQRIFSYSDYTELYTIVYDMCTQRRPNNWSQHLYVKYGETMTNYISNKVLVSLDKRSGVDLLKGLAVAWTNHVLYVKWMTRFFTYLDRYYVKLQAVPSLSCKGYSIFHLHIFSQVVEETRSSLLSVIRSERQEEASADCDLVKKVCSIFIELGQVAADQQSGSVSGLMTYQSEFERYFLPDSKDFYSRQAAGWLEKHSFPEYLLCAEQSLKQESHRVRSYLHPTTEPKLKTQLIEAMFNQNSRRILLDKPTSITFLLENDKKEDLQRAHRLFGFVDGGLVAIANLFRTHVTAAGNSIVEERLERDPAAAGSKKQDLTNDPEFIQKLLDLHEHYKTLVAVSFSQDSLFQKALKEAFEVFVNRDLGRASFASLMSSFCNRLLKKSGPTERLPDEEIESRLTKIVELFNFLSDKDLFSEIYRTQLAKRLLEETSASDDCERSMVGKLKLKCGAQFTSKLEGMLNDLSLSSEQKRKFDDWCREENKLVLNGGNPYGNKFVAPMPFEDELEKDAKITFEFGVTVLATGYWPTYSGVECCLPKQMSVCLDVFNYYYSIQTQHRKLSWIHTQGQATVAGRFKGGRRHDLVGSTLQAIVLLLFAESVSEENPLELTPAQVLEKLTPEEPSSNAQLLDLSQIKRVLGTLACSKYRILSLKRAGEIVDQPKTLQEGDILMVNSTFSSDKRRVRLPTASAASDDSSKPGLERVEEDRSIAVEAAVVRIMKARRSLLHAQLVAEVLQQLHFFRPEPKLIKHRIEHLIDREYLERDADNPQCYRYLA